VVVAFQLGDHPFIRGIERPVLKPAPSAVKKIITGKSFIVLGCDFRKRHGSRLAEDSGVVYAIVSIQTPVAMRGVCYVGRLDGWQCAHNIINSVSIMNAVIAFISRGRATTIAVDERSCKQLRV